MNSLDYIKEDIQNIAEAILSVLNINVTIVDENLIRIAGTGKYLDKIGEKLDGYSAFKKALEEQVSIIIDDPHRSTICKECDSKSYCKEHAEVCCPITLDGYSYGVIGLIAFNDKEKDIIRDNKQGLLNFLGKMADLISNKLKAQIKAEELDLEKKKLEVLIDSIDKPIVSVDINGRIDRYNSKFKEVFNLKDINIDNESIVKILDFINGPLNKDFKKYKTGMFIYNERGQSLKGIYNINKIIVKMQLKGYVIEFIDKRDAIKNYNKINKDYKIILDNIIGESENIKHVKKEAFIASKSSSTVLITGESGTGKELFARAIHNHSDRCENPFIAVNCAAIPDNLLESELFGYEEGAFSGAKKGGKLGKFELAHKGTIFLDEIGDMSLHLQAKLLRVLQEKEVDKIGGKSNVYIDVRIIAATNKDLEDMVQKGSFREDLYYRLNVIPIHLPSLKERKDDIPLLIDYTIKEYSNKLGKNVERVDREVLKTMMDYKWPGNIRELQNIIEYSINMSNSLVITLDVIPQKIKGINVSQIEDDTREIRTLE
ncbi:MAG: sigma-54 interaction domain-containing protein, partial [Peptostreptococcaceae bacterium]